MTWQDVMTVCVRAKAKKKMKKGGDEFLIEPLQCQCNYKVNIDLSRVEEGGMDKSQCRMRQIAGCLDVNNGDTDK